ncbi:type 2 isopentenyl-diphosphate Delta-isomerase [soil metagenome]
MTAEPFEQGDAQTEVSAAEVTVRKLRHIDVCLTQAVEYTDVTTGFERYRLRYNALTQTSLAAVDLTTKFLGATLRAPILVGAMTGGAELSGLINRNLAGAAQQLGIGMMLGSQRIMLDDETATASFEVRDIAPDVLLIGNIGLAQLSESIPPYLAKALGRVGADAVAVHANPLQEAMQSDGDTDFSGSLARLREFAETFEYPVLVKEVGHGIGAAAAARLKDCRIAAVDVAGAGGTSWARVEQLVRYGEVRYPALAEWGVPTAQALLECRATLPDMPLVASGGIRTGMDAAKAIALGADAVSISRPLLPAAIQSASAVTDWLGGFIEELTICLHGCGATDLTGLRTAGLDPT